MKIKKYIPTITMVILTLLGIFGLFLMSAYQNVYREVPDFFYYDVAIYSMPVLALIASLIYYKQMDNIKTRTYIWLYAAILLDLIYIFWQIVERKRDSSYLVPFDFMLSTNIFGYGLGLYNLLMLLPLLIFVICAVFSYFLETEKTRTGLNNSKTIVMIIVVSIAVSLGLRYALLAQVSGKLNIKFISSHSVISGGFGQIYQEEANGPEYLDINFSNPNYVLEEEAIGFVVNAETKFVDAKGNEIDRKSILVNTPIEIVYDSQNYGDARALRVKIL